VTREGEERNHAKGEPVEGKDTIYWEESWGPIGVFVSWGWRRIKRGEIS